MNKKDIYYCFRYKCKRCPKQRECEDEIKRGDTIERRKSNTNEPKKRERS